MRFIRYLGISAVYYGIHKFYILEHFGYLTSMKDLEFSFSGCAFYSMYALLILNRRFHNEREKFFYYILELIFLAPLVTYISFCDNIPLLFQLIFGLSLTIYKFSIGSIQGKLQLNIPIKLIDYFAYVTLFIALVFISKFTLRLNPSDIYDVRAKASDNVTGLFRYILFWSANFSAPYLYLKISRKLADGLIPLILFIVIEMFLFSVGNNKSFLFVLLITISYAYLQKKHFSETGIFNPVVYQKLLLRLVYISTLYIIVYPAKYLLLSVIFFRTLSVGPRQFDLYYSFMKGPSSSPTFLAQSFPFSLFLEYPYNEPLGIVVSDLVLGLENNSNAAFLFSDGIASFGVNMGPIVGFLIFNLVMSLVFYNIHNNYPLRVALLLSFLLQVLNTSILTAFITGGGFLIFLLGLTDKDHCLSAENVQ